MDKIFAIVVQEHDGFQHVKHIEADDIFKGCEDRDIFQADFFIKHAQVGECAIISGTVVFCQKDK